MVRKILLSLPLLVVLLASMPKAQLIVNEVLANEPGAIISLEWVELYNNGTTDAYITFCQLRVSGNGTVDIPLLSGVVPAKKYAVICKDRNSFEAFWGNNSGTWGDDESEDYNLYERPGFTLLNSGGSVQLSCGGLSTLAWTEAGEDGYSWERVRPDSSRVAQSIDPFGATPGRANSQLPEENDLALTGAAAVPSDGGETSFSFTVHNVGLNEITRDSLFLFYDPERDSTATRNDLIAVFDLPDLASGDSVVINTTLTIDGFYADLLAQLMSDDQNANNIIILTAPGSSYPPVILSEFLPDPETPLGSEWVELKNRSGLNVDIGGWYLGDEVSLHPIASDTFTILPYEYIVLCRDSIDFINYYGSPEYRIIELSAWPSLNNDGDLIRLIDNFSFMADSLRYDSGYGGNITWARGEVTGYTDRWGRSPEAGGTPGAENDVLFPAQSNTIDITVDPDPFSPRSDGRVLIQFDLPPGAMTLKVYDVKGREVKTFYDNFASFQGAVQWDGNDNEGKPLPVGIYILYLEVEGYGSQKQTIVIAP